MQSKSVTSAYISLSATSIKTRIETRSAEALAHEFSVTLSATSIKTRIET